MSNVIIYSKDNCNYCVAAKRLLDEKRISYHEMKIGVDITREEFVGLFPEVKTVPFIIINNEKVGGYDKLTEWVSSGAGRSFLAERVS